MNTVELFLITKTVTQCISWILFAGSHQLIKGWYTFFRGQPEANVAFLLPSTPTQAVILLEL
jgi:hypothetical protein